MPIIEENQLINLLSNAKNVLLLEPPFRRSYVPLGLTKMDSYVGKYWTKNLIGAFRNYAITYGYNRGDRTFESWINADKAKQIQLSDEDWNKWNFKR